ncbi:putative proteasome subunit alpha type-7 [Ceratocystis platani]|uniref:Putative proteasome subunit alpha type-7 n=1 Tax=Ceratocystis fimbriata f. sp. platani TaxID=88771 RepID=A0A0F8B203_CERFI|nr:putative proteasome subunit alpha type-7 [Ceratocystis platani]
MTGYQASPAHFSKLQPPPDVNLTSIGTGYDLANSIYSPDGRNFQVEYAVKAVESAGTSIGIRCKDGVVLAVEKIIGSKLLKPGANKRISTVDKHLGVVYSGMIPDGRHFVNRARDEAASFRTNYKSPITTEVLASRMGGYLQAYTCHSYVRPFGITAIIGGFDPEHELPVDGEVGDGPSCGAGGKVTGQKHGGPFLYMIEPSGLFWGYYGAATGKGRQVAKAELEKLDLSAGNLTLEDGVKQAARIIYKSHGDDASKDYELEMTWISNAAGPTKGRHEEVPRELVDEAMKLAKAEDEDDDGDDDDDDEDNNDKTDEDKMED